MDYGNLVEEFKSYRARSMEAFNECIDLVEKLELENKLLKSERSRSTGSSSVKEDGASAIFISKKEASNRYVSNFSSVDLDVVNPVEEKEELLSNLEFLRRAMRNRRF